MVEIHARVALSTRTGKNLLKEIKRIAVEEDTKVYLVMEKALEGLIKQRISQPHR